MATATMNLAFVQPTLGDLIHELTTVLPKLAPRDVDFACKIVAYYNKHRRLSDGYMPWPQKLIDRANGMAATAKPQVGDLSGLIGLFTTAKAKLKWPKIKLTVTGKAVVLSLAGEKSKAPGSINVAGEGGWGERAWYGRVSPDGSYEPSRSMTPEFAAALVDVLKKLSTDPLKTVQDFGKLTGQCMFCNLPLNDPRSTTAGFGETCAKNWGLHAEWKQAAK